MNSKTKWSIQLGTVSLALALSAVPLSAQIHIPGMPFGFMKADAARDLYNSGRTLYENNKYAEAEAKFKEVLKKYPRNNVADDSGYYLILALSKQRKFDEARAQIELFKKQYSKSEWLGDVQEEQMRLTNELPPAYVLALTPTPPAPPAQAAAARASQAQTNATPTPAPPAGGVRVPGVIVGPPVAIPGRGQRAPVSPEVSFQQEVLRVLFESDPDRAIEIAADRLKAEPTDQVVLGNLYMVANSKSMKALPLLVTLAKTSPDSRTRRDAVSWISRSRGEKDALADILISLVPSMTTDEDSSGITYALSQVNTPKTIDALAGIARDKSKSDRVRNDALNWIAESRVTNRLTLLEDIYKSNMDNPRTRRQIIPYIGRSKDPQAVTILGSIAISDPDMNVKRDAVTYLGQIKTPEAMKALEALLTKKP
jgi:HEAT repeat protein